MKTHFLSNYHVHIFTLKGGKKTSVKIVFQKIIVHCNGAYGTPTDKHINNSLKESLS